MDKQQGSLHAETINHETAGEETWVGGDASLNIIELQPISFSAKAIQHGRHPTNAGRMEHPDAYASRVGWCGEVMEMYLRLDGNRIVAASFWADGCLSTMACGDMLTTMARGMVLEDAMAITPQTLIAALDGLPYKSHHCAELSVETLREAIATGWANRR
ncbi:MAG: iron-sulfur cluster assembly scaffold protein [Chloroflexi bacterium]|nr:iron-sulfur cluster assembly scaffold protein [Chloroflexota bacterium]